MEVPHRALQKADRAKLKYVYCISHSNWNDGYDTHYEFRFTKRHVIEQDVHWVQITDQNKRLSYSRYGNPAKPAEFAPYFWMRDSIDPKVKFLWDRMLVSTRPDPSDAGMAWFLVTGDEECTPEKLKTLLEDRTPPARIATRASIWIEAENFRRLEGFTVDVASNDRGAAHRVNIRADGPTARMRTRFDEPFAGAVGRYDVEIRYKDDIGADAQFAFFLNGVATGVAWRLAGRSGEWTSHIIPALQIKLGDELRLDVESGGARIDFVQLNARGSTPGAPASTSKREQPVWSRIIFPLRTAFRKERAVRACNRWPRRVANG
jgi:hypothetical protein